MSAPKKPGVLEPVRGRVRRFQLVVGLGLLAFVAGSFVASELMLRFDGRLRALGSPAVAFLVGMVISRLWLWAMLPAFCYAAARLLQLRPWSTAIGAAITGELFSVAILSVSAGLEGLSRPPLDYLAQAGTLAVGMVLTRLAIGRGRAAAQRTQAAAAGLAASRGPEYQAFAAKAEGVDPAPRPPGEG